MDQRGKLYKIHGSVTGRNGEPLRGARVVVWWQHIRERKELAAGETSEHGQYQISYKVPENAPQPLLLIVEALSEYLDAPLLSPLTQAQSTLLIDLNFEPPDQSEWTTLVRSIDPLLDGLKLSELVESSTHQDISFLATELGKSTEVVMRVGMSARLEAAFNIPAPAFYAFLRQQVPATLPSPLLDASQNFTMIAPLVQNVASMLFALSADVQTQTITAAVALDLIGPQFTKQISQLVNELQALRTTNLLTQPYLVGNATLAQLLDVAAIPPAKQQAFAQALATNTQPITSFWTTLGNGQNGFTAAEASSIELTLSIGAFVQNFVPLLQNLVGGFSSGTYKTLADLARLSQQDWLQLINQAGPPSGTVAPGTATSAEALASVVYARVTHTYPTVALSSRIAAASLVPQAQQQPLIQFFQNNADLELLTDNFAVYVANQGDAAFAGIDQADQSAVVANARSFQRVIRVAPNPDVAQTLLSMGITSATQISTLGQQQFLIQATAAGLTGPQATQAFQAAAQRYAGVVAIYTKLNSDSIGVLPKAIGFSDLDTKVTTAIARDPNLATLFGSQDYCATDDCTSVLSPAAYLCDLLLWLRNHKQGANTVLDVLDGRRPDIRNLLLNCPNTDTELPYIDLVNELLADKIAPTPVTKLTSGFQAVTNGFVVDSDAGFPSPNFYVTIDSEILLVKTVGGAGNTTWTVSRAQQGTAVATHQMGAAVTLIDSINPQWKQTSVNATAAQLSAAPEYFNQGAYIKLFNASYPQSLPYSTGLDGLRTYLQQWNLPLWQLRQALLPLNGVTAAQQAAVAAERFGIPPHGEFLIVNANSVAPATAWNTSNPLADLASVPTFLQAANITYESLLELLLVAWVQGESNVQIQGIDDTCTTTKQVLEPLKVDWLDRAHRFLRLWLATGYKMWELDLLLSAPSVGNQTLDENALAGLLFFRQLQDATGLAVDQQLAFYQDIDTGTHRDPDGTTTTSLYAQIFLNPTVTWAAPDPDMAALSTGGFVTDLLLSDHAKAIQPALGVSGTDLTTLSTLTDGLLTLDDLSLIYRANALAAASSLPVSDLFRIACLLSPAAPDPLAALTPLLASPADTLAFLAQATDIRQSGLTLDALPYLLTPPAGTTLVAHILAADTTINVVSGLNFPSPSFYISIGSETLIVTAVSGFGNAIWTVLRGQQGTTAAPAPIGAGVDLIGGWATTTQMTPANIATALGEVQQAVAGLLAASTTLAAPIGAIDTTIAVTSDVNFPSPTFYVYIGSEILLVTAVGGTGNTTWTVARGQQGTTAAFATTGAAVSPTSGDLDGSVITAVAANAHTPGAAPLAKDVSALILQTLQVPGTGSTLLTVLENPLLLAAAGTITIGGSPTTGVFATPGDKQVTIGWIASPGATSYNIYWSKTKGVTPATGTAITGAANPCVQTGLTDGVTYYYVVTAVNSLGESAPSPQVSATPAAATAIPSAPAGVSAIPGNAQVTINWSSVPGATSYNIYSSTTPGVTIATGTETPGVANPYTQAGLTNGAKYYYIVAAVNSLGTSAPSLQVSATPAVPLAPPLAPAGVSASPGNGQNTLAWNNVPGATSYNIYSSTTPGVTTVSGTKITGVANPFIQAGLIDNTEYFYIVTAVDSGGESAPSLQVSATPAAPVAIPFPPPWDTLQAVLTSSIGVPVAVSYTLTQADNGNVSQTASDFAQAINLSNAVVGLQAFLAPCTVSGAVITLMPLVPGGIGSSVSSSNTASPGGPGHVSISPATAETIGQPAFLSQFLAIQLFDKVGVLVRGLRLVATDLTWLLANAGVYGGLNLTQLPVVISQPPLPLISLLTTLLVIKLARLWTAAAPASLVQTLYDVIAGVSTGALANTAQAQSALQTITGWPLADIEAFAAALGLVFPAMYEQPASYDALRRLETMASAVTAGGGDVSPTPSTTLVNNIIATDTSITVASDIGFPSPPFYVYIGSEILQVTGVSGGDNTAWTVSRQQQGTTAAIAPAGAVVAQTLAAQIVSWGSVPPDEASAENLAASALGTLKAQQATSDAWLALAPVAMNPIRQNRSAALQSYLIAQRDSARGFRYVDDAGLPGAAALFKYFLIDVQMSSCEETSRVVQAYIAVQIFVERCRMNLEAPGVVVDLTRDDTWNQWEWMSRYRIWEANREVFLYPENWLIESQRPNRTEIYQKFEQEVRQGQSTADYLETVVLNYIDRLDGLAHLHVTGTCEDPATGDIYVVARTLADPPVFYSRSYVKLTEAWGGWSQIPLDIKAYQAIPAVYRGRVCLFWMDVKVSTEPQQKLPAPQASSAPPSQEVERYVSLGVNFSIFRNGSWAPAQTSKGKLFDKPLLNSGSVSDTKAVESLYTLKVRTPAISPGFGANLWVDVFRFGDYNNDARTIVAAEQLAEAEAALVGIFAGGGSAPTPTPTPTLDQAVAQVVAQIEAQATFQKAVHVGRAVFDGRFSDLELNNLNIAVHGQLEELYTWAVNTYGPDAQPLLPLTSPDSDLTGDSRLIPQAGALTSLPVNPFTLALGIANPTQVLNFTSAGALEQFAGPLLAAAPIPLRIVSPDAHLNFDPTSWFFFQDNRRCYWVKSQKYYQRGNTWSATAPKDAGTAPYYVYYDFRAFYHPFTRLFWNQLAGGDFDLLYDPNLQQVPDDIDPSYSDLFSFQSGYQPTGRVGWDLADATTTLASSISAFQPFITVTNNIWIPSPQFYVSIGSEILQVLGVGTNNAEWIVERGQQGTSAVSALSGAAVTPTRASQDRQFLDFSTSAAYSVYNWELFYHIPLYIAQLLSQNQQFENAQTWFQYIFNPTRQGTDPVPGRFWIPKPLHNLISGQILAQQIDKLLQAVTQHNKTAVAEVEAWRNDPFNPFVLADMRNGVPYMKSTVMSYLDNLIAWGDNLFSTESREALSEATLIYVIASEILGPTPIAVTPSPHADESFAQLAPSLDAFANAMAEIENVIGGAGGSSASGKSKGIPAPQTFYFTIPSNPKLLGYWSTVADRLYKLRNCQTIAGAPLQLALFDAPIDPGLLIAGQAAGLDLSSVLSNLGASLPNYRFTSLYPFALDFVNAVRAYAVSFQAALEKIDAGTLAMLQQTTQKQLLAAGSDILDWQVQQAQRNLDALNETLALAQQKYNFNSSQTVANAAEIAGAGLHAESSLLKVIAAAATDVGAIAAVLPSVTVGMSGFGGSPVLTLSTGGMHASTASHLAGINLATVADVLEIAAGLSTTNGVWQRRKDNWNEAATEAQIQITQANIQIAGAQLALQINQQNQTVHQEQIDHIQQQIDFLNNKFTSDSLYDWMANSLAATYFKSYQLAYQLCQQVERCYQFELGIQNSSFIQFGYWDNLHKGLLAGENLNHDLRRMQASYLQQNARRYELSRFVSLGQLNPTALQQLLVTGACDFNLPELLFDNDYPGHYNRRLTRVSLTVVYPNPGKFDNVKATLTLVANQVRTSTDASAGYPEQPVGSDPRFVYNYAAVPQKIATGNAQDDPGLFITTISNNIVDQRYLPFENAGAVSSWHLTMPQANNEIDLTTVGDVVLHLHYTALDGGAPFQQAVLANNAANLPTSGVKVFSAQNDFAPLTPWTSFLATVVAPANQTLTLTILPTKFPPWTRGKTISVTSLTVLAVAWQPGNFVLAPQAPLPPTQLPMTPVGGSSVPNICAATIAMPANTPVGTWSFELQQKNAANFRSLTAAEIGDVLLMVSYTVS